MTCLSLVLTAFTQSPPDSLLEKDLPGTIVHTAPAAGGLPEQYTGKGCT